MLDFDPLCQSGWLFVQVEQQRLWSSCASTADIWLGCCSTQEVGRNKLQKIQRFNSAQGLWDRKKPLQMCLWYRILDQISEDAFGAQGWWCVESQLMTAQWDTKVDDGNHQTWHSCGSSSPGCSGSAWEVESGSIIAGQSMVTWYPRWLHGRWFSDATVDGRNPASPKMYKALYMQSGINYLWTGAGFFCIKYERPGKELFQDRCWSNFLNCALCS